MVLFINDSAHYIDLPSWTALTRIVAEADTLWASAGNIAELLGRAENTAVLYSELLLDRALDVALGPTSFALPYMFWIELWAHIQGPLYDIFLSTGSTVVTARTESLGLSFSSNADYTMKAPVSISL
eukprot:3140389-Amphidinium_carterae.1